MRDGLPNKLGRSAIGGNVRSDSSETSIAAHKEDNGLLQLPGLGFGFFQDGNVGVGVFPEGEESSGGIRYCGSPTFRTSAASRGSDRRGSSKKSVFKRTSCQSRS